MLKPLRLLIPPWALAGRRMRSFLTRTESGLQLPQSWPKKMQERARTTTGGRMLERSKLGSRLVLIATMMMTMMELLSLCRRCRSRGTVRSQKSRIRRAGTVPLLHLRLVKERGMVAKL